MPSVHACQLTDYVERIFEAIDTPSEQAKLLARQLVRAHLRGHASHGVARIKQYMDAYEAGTLDPKAKPTVEVEGACYANINGNRSFGQVAATFATELAIKKAKDSGLCMVGCYNINHVGCLGDYVMMVAEQGFVGMAFCNGGGPNVAPFGARERVLGVNPVAFAAPSESGRIPVMDFTSGATAEGKLQLAKNKGETVPEGLLLDKDGNPTTCPGHFYDEGAILTIGGHRGSALSLMIEILAGILPGGRCSAFEDYIEGNGVLLFAIKPDLFRKKADFGKDIDLLYSAVTGAKKAAGIERIWFPGELEQECYNTLSHEKIELNEKTWEAVTSIGDSLNVSFE